MTATIIATLKITDTEKLAAYRGHAANALAKHGGKIIAAGKLGTTLEGANLPGDAVAVMEFDTADAAKNWIGDPELKDVHALRNASGTSSITVIE